MLRYTLLALTFICATLLGENPIDKIFAFPKGEIVYYHGTKIYQGDYKAASVVKQGVTGEGRRLYSVVIADILGETNANEVIALYSDGKERFSIYDTNGTNLYNFEVDVVKPDSSQSAIEIHSFKDASGAFRILKYYVRYENETYTKVDMYLFKVIGTRFAYITEVEYYSEVPCAGKITRIHLRNKFVDVNKDGALDFLVEQEYTRGDTRSINYLFYRYDFARKTYRFVIQDNWDAPPVVYDYSAYF